MMLVSSPDTAIDANLAIALDALLAENSVTRAAARLHTSPAAMSRTLARLRRILQDPLLVRAGQTMVPTPRAQALREEAAAVVRSLGALLSPGASVDPAGLRGTFTLQAADLVGAALTPGLLHLAQSEAPGVSFRVRAEELEAAPHCATAGSTWRSDPSTTWTRKPRSKNWSASAWWQPYGPVIRSPMGR